MAEKTAPGHTDPGAVLSDSGISVPLHAVLGDEGVDQRGFLGLFGAVDEAAAVLGGGSVELIRRAVEGGEALALVDVVAALLVEGDAGGEVQRVALLLTACAQQNAGRADLLASLVTM